MDAAPPKSPEESNAEVVADVIHILREADLPADVFRTLVAKVHLLPGKLGAKGVAQDDPPAGNLTPPPQRDPQTSVVHVTFRRNQAISFSA